MKLHYLLQTGSASEPAKSGRDGFHSVPDSSRPSGKNFRDAVERVPAEFAGAMFVLRSGGALFESFHWTAGNAEYSEGRFKSVCGALILRFGEGVQAVRSAIGYSAFSAVRCGGSTQRP